MRYDTYSAFTSGTYGFYDVGTNVNANCKGFRGAVFDGKYIYFVPNYGNISGVIMRYDTTATFASSGSYAIFDSTTVNANSKGFWGGVFDGRYVYFVPYNNGSAFGQITRYDTTGSFTSSGSYAVYNTASANANSKGFCGAVFDGKYIYFVPNNNGAVFGQVTRYDTTQSFTSASSYAFFDTTSINANSKKIIGGFYDGKYVYLCPNGAGVYTRINACQGLNTTVNV